MTAPPPATDPPPAAATLPVLSVREARRRYGERQALAGVDLEARPGEILVLLGPNGAGKTTLLRAISGGTVLDGGHITVDGAPAGNPAARARVGVVPQAMALYGQLSVQANLEIFGQLAGLNRADLGPAVERALKWTGLSDRARDRVAHLSGGMQRRVNLAAGTLHSPRLLLLDEPTVGLDPAARDAIHQALRQLRQQGMALLMTTHDLEEAESLADRVALLCEGRVVASGPVAALVEQAFDRGQEVNLRLRGDVDETRAAQLARAGLSPAGAERWWVGVLHEEDPDGSLTVLRSRVMAAGFTVEEVRVRRPGLHGVFLRLAGRNLANGSLTDQGMADQRPADSVPAGSP